MKPLTFNIWLIFTIAIVIIIIIIVISSLSSLSPLLSKLTKFVLMTARFLHWNFSLAVGPLTSTLRWSSDLSFLCNHRHCHHYDQHHHWQSIVVIILVLFFCKRRSRPAPPCPDPGGNGCPGAPRPRKFSRMPRPAPPHPENAPGFNCYPAPLRKLFPLPRPEAKKGVHPCQIGRNGFISKQTWTRRTWWSSL